MVFLKTRSEIDRIREAGKVVAEVLARIGEAVRPGVSTLELDELADSLIRSNPDCSAAFKGYGGFPNALCTSVNEEVVHGIPKKEKVLKEGDLVSLDVGVFRKGYFADAAATFSVGPPAERQRKLLDCTRRALSAGIEQAVDENRIGDIGAAVQKVAQSENFSVVRDLVGHGIGQNLHEDPQVPNFGIPKRGYLIKEGLVLAIEPMVNEGTHEIRTLADNWTVVTADGKLSVHFEHTVAIGPNGPEILTG
ncbi:MAG: type I methionyl aminopeptidase [Candidatus Glassbacteria bacterium RIFCSPLOWO2_12_FULL_58_11]|uniref:Methionine aminopeptidase n=2 Tax=Candidatus Glassiibacteriota TaxID=1817805 RepID=A0A1F5YPS6_9BACT|nr:MAG: type I methionyl aminopeptidase [Candidatus Glassbacteria bacterium GWA2_58_10]OGG01987.1 MAG: type I methionyl aminopeptidase [Candidatus Glassbacteria bacterium RIFCSPLOWO2_12_FULL_58_11]